MFDNLVLAAIRDLQTSPRPERVHVLCALLWLRSPGGEVKRFAHLGTVGAVEHAAEIPIDLLSHLPDLRHWQRQFLHHQKQKLYSFQAAALLVLLHERWFLLEQPEVTVEKLFALEPDPSPMFRR